MDLAVIGGILGSGLLGYSGGVPQDICRGVKRENGAIHIVLFHEIIFNIIEIDGDARGGLDANTEVSVLVGEVVEYMCPGFGDSWNAEIAEFAADVFLIVFVSHGGFVSYRVESDGKNITGDIY